MAEKRPYRNPSPPPEIVKVMKAMLGNNVPITSDVIAKITGAVPKKTSITSNDFHALATGANCLLPKTTSLKSSLEAKRAKSTVTLPNDKAKESSSSSSSSDCDNVGQWKHDLFDPNSDYYCKMCKSSMNSDLTWQSHIAGKKHLKKLASLEIEKNKVVDPLSQAVKVNPGGPPMIRTIRKKCVPRIQSKIDSLNAPFVGLDFVSEIQKPEPELEPIYYCYLCSAQCVLITILSHLIGYKHKMNYLKYSDREVYDAIKWMTMRKSHLTAIAEEHAIRLAKIDGSGQIQVEVEDPLGTYPGEKEINHCSMTISSLISEIPRDLQSWPSSAKIDIMKILSNPKIQTDYQVDELKYIIESLSESVLCYKDPNVHNGL